MGYSLRRALLALVNGGVVPLAFAPYDLYWIIFPCIALAFAQFEDASPRLAMVLGFIFGIGMFGHGVSWVQVSVHQFGLPLYSFSVTVTIGFVAILCLFPALCAYAFARAAHSPRYLRYVLLAPALWTLSEMLRATIFTGFPWLNLGHSQTDSPLAGFSPLLSAYGVSYVCVLLGGVLVLAVRGARADRIAAGLVVVFVMVALGALSQITFTETAGEPAEVALIQGAVPQAIKWNRAYREPSIELYSTLSEPHWGKALIVWPETAIPAFAEEVPEVVAALDARAKETATSLFVGMPTGDATNVGDYFNSVIQLGTFNGRYDKTHLVPFGEYLPFDKWLRPALNFLHIPMSSFSPGANKQGALNVGSIKVGVSICYEDAYISRVASALPEAHVLVNVSNDAWFGNSIAPHQHLQMARMRAIEMGRYLLRATNTGITAVIDDRGKVIARTVQFEPDVISAEFIPRSGATPTARFPMIIPFVLCLAGLALFAFAHAFVIKRAARRQI